MSRTKIIPRVGNNGLTLLEQKRIECGLTAVGLSRQAGVSRNVIWKLESRANRFTPRADTIGRILSVLNQKHKEITGRPLDFDTLFEMIRSQ